VAIPSNPAPEFCSACGFPLRGPRCEACGVDRVSWGGRRAGVAPDADVYDADVEAWRARDPIRFVGHCVTAEAGAGVQPTSSHEGLGWIFSIRTAAVFVSLDTAGERIAIDVPVARVPDRQRVPALRAALELSEDLAPARLCLRDDLIVLRRVSRVAAVTAASLRQALRASPEAAERLGGLFATWFDARPPFSEEQRSSLSWALAGRSRPLKSFSIPPPPARALPPPPPASVRLAAAAPPPLPPLPPMSGRLASAEPGWSAPKPQPESGRAALLREPDVLPDILSPLFAGSPTSSPSTSASAPEPATPGRAAASARPDNAPLPAPPSLPGTSVPLSGSPPTRPPHPPSNRPGPTEPPRASGPPGMGALPAEARGSELPGALTSPTSPASPASPASPTSSERRTATPLPVMRAGSPVDAAAPPFSVPVSIRPPAAAPDADADAQTRKERSPADRFCQLLRDAQALATAVSFQDRPGVMLIIIRSTVFRSILEHGESLPHAVAHLYRATATVTRDLAQAEAGGRRASPALIAEPALHAMERMVSARGQVPDEKALQIEPLTSAAHAREHLTRYLREIERAPAEPGLRHFLALGALSELLVRARLPQKTDQRLREIVAYAHREGPKSTPIELMMTALNRIVAQ